MIRGRMRRLLCWIFVCIAQTAVAYKSVRQFSHPIQVLLLRYAGSVPPERDLVTAAKQGTGAAVAVEDLLRSPDAQESWSGAIVALGVIGGPRHFLDISEKLARFMNTRDRFGCPSATCEPLAIGEMTRYWDRQARLVVPLSLGYLMRHVAEGEPSPPPEVALALSAIITRLTVIGKASSSESLIPACVTSLAPQESQESCNIELQMNAVHGLQRSHVLNGIEGLREIAEHGQNPLVAREAEMVLAHTHHSPK